MTDLDEHITRVLHRHADDTEIENNLDVIVAGGGLVRFTNDNQHPGRRNVRLLVAAAATVLVVAGGVALTQVATAPANEPVPVAETGGAPVTTPTGFGAPIFPVIGDVPERLGRISATQATFVRQRGTSVTLGRVDGDQLTDVVNVYAARLDDPDAEDVLVPPGAEITSATIGTTAVDVHTNAGGRWYRWVDNGMVFVVEASSDSEMIVAEISGILDPETGRVDVTFGVLPAGLEIIATPTPLTGTHPGLGADQDSGGPIFGLNRTYEPFLPIPAQQDGFTIVDINGATGYAISYDGGASIVWQPQPDAWLQLSLSESTTDDAIELARNVTLVDQTAWQNRYQTTFDDQATPTLGTVPDVNAADPTNGALNLGGGTKFVVADYMPDGWKLDRMEASPFGSVFPGQQWALLDVDGNVTGVISIRAPRPLDSAEESEYANNEDFDATVRGGPASETEPTSDTGDPIPRSGILWIEDSFLMDVSASGDAQALIRPVAEALVIDETQLTVSIPDDFGLVLSTELDFTEQTAVPTSIEMTPESTTLGVSIFAGPNTFGYGLDRLVRSDVEWEPVAIDDLNVLVSTTLGDGRFMAWIDEGMFVYMSSTIAISDDELFAIVRGIRFTDADEFGATSDAVALQGNAGS